MNTSSNEIMRSSAEAVEKPAAQHQPKQIATSATTIAITAESAPIPGGTAKADEALPAYWIAKISSSMGFVAGWCVKVGQELSAAKAALGHGGWTKLFEPDGLGISLRTAETLMAVGNHPYFMKSKNLSNLPPSYSALYALSRLDEKVIALGVKEGVIGPGMKISDAKRFVAANQQPPATPVKPIEFQVEKRLNKLRRYVLGELEQWPKDQLSRLAESLVAIADEIGPKLNEVEKPSQTNHGTIQA